MQKNVSVLTLIFLLFANFNIVYAQGWALGKACSCDCADGWAVATDGKSAVYMAGVYSGLTGAPLAFGKKSAPLPGSSYYQTVWAKFDLNGNLQWVSGTVSGNTYLQNITTDPDGNLIIFGSFSSATMQIGSFILKNTYTTGLSQYFLAKIDPSGNVLWAINDGNIFYLYLVITKYIFSVGGVTTDTAGNIYITSEFSEPTMNIGSTTITNSDPSGKTNDIFVAKYTPSGVPVWATSIGGLRDDYSLGITVPPNGNVYISGTFYSPSVSVGSVTLSNPYTQNLACIAKFSGSSGIPLWGQNAGDSKGAVAIGIASDISNNVYLTGSFIDTSITFGTSSFTRPILASSPKFASFLVQYSPSDVVTWGKCLASPKGDVYCYSIALAPCGQIWVSGSYSDRVVIAPGDTLALVSGGDPVFIAGYNLSGGIAGYSGAGAGGDDQINIASDANGNIYMCGDNTTTTTIGPDVLPAVIDEAMFISKYANSSRPDTVLGKDTTICIGNSGGFTPTTITATNGYAMYYWNDGLYAQTRTITMPGRYYVYDITCGKPVRVDTFNILPLIPTLTTNSRDTAACVTSGIVKLSAPSSYLSCLWNTGSTAKSILAIATGTYWVYTINVCDEYVDTIHVSSISKFHTVNLGNDTTFCIGNIYQLSSSQPEGFRYLWNNGSTDSFISISESGVYRLTVNSNWCYGSDSLRVNVIKPPSTLNLGPDSALCIGHTVILFAHPEDYTNFLWSTGTNENSIAVTESGSYWLSAYNICGSVSDTINLDFRHCEIWLPTAFTPNGDGLNDILRAIGQFNFITKFSLSIYNRYGQRVYYSEDLHSGWDGNFNGTKQDLGTYYYVMEFTLENKKQLIKGDVELIR